ncbi:hypothetical protein M0804_004539 [Polistes exclamans]|nr:hypothetical protein M0804_004539 [Polistes exclamans]
MLRSWDDSEQGKTCFSRVTVLEVSFTVLTSNSYSPYVGKEVYNYLDTRLLNLAKRQPFPLTLSNAPVIDRAKVKGSLKRKVLSVDAMQLKTRQDMTRQGKEREGKGRQNREWQEKEEERIEVPTYTTSRSASEVAASCGSGGGGGAGASSLMHIQRICGQNSLLTHCTPKTWRLPYFGKGV